MNTLTSAKKIYILLYFGYLEAPENLRYFLPAGTVATWKAGKY